MSNCLVFDNAAWLESNREGSQASWKDLKISLKVLVGKRLVQRGNAISYSIMQQCTCVYRVACSLYVMRPVFGNLSPQLWWLHCAHNLWHQQNACWWSAGCGQEQYPQGIIRSMNQMLESNVCWRGNRAFWKIHRLSTMFTVLMEK